MVKVGIIRNVKTLVDETLYTKVGSEELSGSSMLH